MPILLVLKTVTILDFGQIDLDGQCHQIFVCVHQILHVWMHRFSHQHVFTILTFQMLYKVSSGYRWYIFYWKWCPFWILLIWAMYFESLWCLHYIPHVWKHIFVHQTHIDTFTQTEVTGDSYWVAWLSGWPSWIWLSWHML